MIFNRYCGMNQIEKDTRWLLEQPALMTLTPALDALPWLRRHLPSWAPDQPWLLPSIQPRLGHYYEDLVNLVLTNTAQLSVIKRNLQIRQGRSTVGEFDFLGRDDSAGVFHLECAIKFYLRTGDGSELNHFVGPNRRDRLDLKWAKLIQQQIALSQHPAAQAQLAELGVHVTLRRVLLQGFLFHPFGEPVPRLHPAINPQHSRGWWLRSDEACAVIRSPYRFKLMAKPFWLYPDVDAGLLSPEQCLEYLAQAERPRLVARMTYRDGEWQEWDRGFVVPVAW